jgi:hypothetical protein
MGNTHAMINMLSLREADVEAAVAKGRMIYSAGARHP